MYFGHHYWGMHLFWWIFWFAALALLLGVPWLLRARQPGESPHDILRRRFAYGEITEEEYRHRLEILGSGGASATAPA